jgi:hypothetical protein
MTYRIFRLVMNTFQRITVKDDQVGAFALFEQTDIQLKADRPGRWDTVGHQGRCSGSKPIESIRSG